jgi:hypothetical protein
MRRLLAAGPSSRAGSRHGKRQSKVRRRLEEKASEFDNCRRKGILGALLDETELLEAERWFLPLILANLGILSAGNQVILTTVRRLAADGTSKLYFRSDQALILSVAAFSISPHPSIADSLRAGLSQLLSFTHPRDQGPHREVASSLLSRVQRTGYVLAFLHGNLGFA